jgi:hypothetical protein
MSDCCTPGTGFPNAALMQQMSLNNPTVWAEICALQQAILSASSQCQPGGGKMCTTVGGTTPMTFVSGVTDVIVNNGGSGYIVDNPAVYFRPPVGTIPTIIATADVISNGGNILAIEITDPGLGYQPVPALLTVSSLAGFGANLQPIVNSTGNIVSINIAAPGSGYTVDDTVFATRAVLPNVAYVDAVFKITSIGIAGEILEVAILNPGSGYQPSVTEVVIVSSIDSNIPYPLGSGFSSSVLTDINGEITGVVITNTGAGYSVFNPYLVITDPGAGAETIVSVMAGSVSSVNVIEPGTGYTTGAIGTVFNPPTASLPNPPATPATVTVNVATNTYGTNPNLYWQVWAGLATDKQVQMQLNAVLSYFTGLGYTINVQTNPDTGSTISWKICW